ncbi:putative DNA topoisomerase III (plasmid) [Magnetospirillum sp. XM-1]|uniref:DNA topoisomerase n=1 Tax=Magnetospirillum sp. XM-1 TaxID=1663591 RepID=UPI00073DF38A|nr:DNA topoisomerase [Magnetospirillum sp. XM-1]CUW41935.1 putative DNA topoisomerase III [Magnetospirillum sp. XM-1]
MPANVYLCEKYNQASDIAGVLGVVRRHDGWFEVKGGDAVTFASGHLLALLYPEDYDPAYSSWQDSVLPIVPAPFRHRPRDSRAAGQLKVIRGLLAGASRVVLCTDPDREGELIGREILRELRWSGPVERAWLPALTKPIITKALAALLPGTKTAPLADAALARSQADWLIGMNLTRGLSRRLAGRKTCLNVGRVQTPTLALLVRREREIASFVQQSYFEIRAVVEASGIGPVEMRYAPPAEERLVVRADAQAIAASVAGAVAPIRSKEEAKSAPPPAFYALSSLQMDADRLLGFDADRTLKVAQALYDEKKVLTYPRTDCAHLPDEFAADAPALLGLLAGMPELAAVAGRAAAAPVLRTGSHYDSSKLKSHHAITLTGTDPSGLTGDERELFLLVARRFLAAHLPDHEYISTTLTWMPGAHAFVARGRVPTRAGWKEAFDAGGPEEDGDDEAARPLPKIPDGTQGTGKSAAVEEKTTRPPSRFTEGQLIDAMKNIARFVTDPAAKSRLRATSGLGTDATRSPMIAELKKRGHIVREKGRLRPSGVATALIGAVEKHIPAWADPVTTALWEDELEAIAEGKGQIKPFLDGIVAKLRSDIAVLDALSVPWSERISAEANPTPVSAKAPRGRGKASGRPAPAKTPQPASTASGTPSAAPAAGRTDLRVAFADKDKAKALGARWDADRRTWYVPAGAALDPFRNAGFLAA